MRIFPRRPRRGPRRRDLLKRREHWLRPGEVPTARVEVDPDHAALFDRFNAFRAELAHGRELPIELYVLLQLDGTREVSVWTLPSKALEPILVGYLSQVDLPGYQAMLDRLPPDLTPMARFYARREGPGRYAAIVEGLPADWSTPPWREQ